MAPRGEGASLASDAATVLSPETYVGYARAERFASPGGLARDAAKDYAVPARLSLNAWALGGDWTVRADAATSNGARAKIVFRFQARDLRLVLGPVRNGSPVAFRVRPDGREPGTDHGTDVDASGAGTVSEQRLYQLIRQSGEIRDRVLEIEFSDPGVMAYAFTFG